MLPWILLRVLGMPDWFDSELVIVIAMAAGGVYLMWQTQRDNAKDAYERIDLHARLARVEALIGGDSPVSIDARLARVEALIGGDSPVSIDARVSSVEGWVEAHDASVGERVATLEARVDHKPITQTRRKDGKFAKADDVLTTIAAEEIKP